MNPYTVATALAKRVNENLTTSRNRPVTINTVTAEHILAIIESHATDVDFAIMFDQLIRAYGNTDKAIRDLWRTTAKQGEKND